MTTFPRMLHRVVCAAPDQTAHPRCIVPRRLDQFNRAKAEGVNAWAHVIAESVDPVVDATAGQVGILLNHPFGLTPAHPRMGFNFAQAVECAADPSLSYLVRDFVPAWRTVDAFKFAYIGHVQPDQRSPMLQAQSLRPFRNAGFQVGMDSAAPENAASPSAELRTRLGYSVPPLHVESVPPRPDGMHWLSCTTATVGVVALWERWQECFRHPASFATLDEIAGMKTAILTAKPEGPADVAALYDQCAHIIGLGMVPALDVTVFLEAGINLEPLLYGHIAQGVS